MLSEGSLKTQAPTLLSARRPRLLDSCLGEEMVMTMMMMMMSTTMTVVSSEF